MYLPPRDRIFQIEVTTQCNLKCQGCSRTVGVNAGTWKNQHMPLEVFREAIAHARPAQAIILQGIGEPTLHPQFPELISIAHDSGKFHTITFYTNALARNMEYYDDLQKRGNNLLTVSVDSLNQEVADMCRAGTDVPKLLRRLCDLYYTYSPNMNISLVLSRKNLADSFRTFDILNKIASAGPYYITVFVQKMLATSGEIANDYVMRAEDTALFRDTMRKLKASYPRLRLGLCGDLDMDRVEAVQASAVLNALPVLCDKPYLDRFVTIDGYLAPCCVLNTKDEWHDTPLGRPLANVFETQSAVMNWYRDYEVFGHKGCAGCSLMEPIEREIISAVA